MMKAFPQWLSPAALLSVACSFVVGIALGALSFRPRESVATAVEAQRLGSHRDAGSTEWAGAAHRSAEDAEKRELTHSMAEQANDLASQGVRQGHDVAAGFRLLNFLMDWGDDDPEAALAWVRQANLGPLRKSATGLILSSYANVNSERALKMAIDLSRSGNADEVEPYVVMNIGMKHQPGNFAEIFELPLRQGYTEKGRVEFNATTNFQQVGEYVLQKFQEAGDKEWIPAAFPSNFVEEWAKRDPQAAYDFAVERYGMPDQSLMLHAFEDFTIGYSQIASYADAAEMVHYFLSTKDVKVDTVNLASRLADGTPDQFRILEEAIRRLPETEAPRLASRIALRATEPEKTETRRRGLSLLRNPEHRMITVRNFLENHPTQREEMRGHLTALGHTEAQIEWALSPPVGETR